MTFLASVAGAPTPEADALVVGVPVGSGASFRGGAERGPEGVRAFSDSVESYSPRVGADLEDLRVIDVGDVDVGAVGSVVGAAWTQGPGPLIVGLGGDHSVTPPLVASVAERCPRLAVVAFDAHLDLRSDYAGEHACTFRRISDSGVPCVVLGVRSGAASEWKDAPEILMAHSDQVVVEPALVRQLSGRPVYLSVDIDVLDPSVAPGTGNPEPGGVSYPELLEAIESLRGLDVVAADVVEVSPPLDPSGVTQVTAAVLLREMILRFS